MCTTKMENDACEIRLKVDKKRRSLFFLSRGNRTACREVDGSNALCSIDIGYAIPRGNILVRGSRESSQTADLWMYLHRGKLFSPIHYSE